MNNHAHDLEESNGVNDTNDLNNNTNEDAPEHIVVNETTAANDCHDSNNNGNGTDGTEMNDDDLENATAPTISMQATMTRGGDNLNNDNTELEEINETNDRHEMNNEIIEETTTPINAIDTRTNTNANAEDDDDVNETSMLSCASDSEWSLSQHSLGSNYNINNENTDDYSESVSADDNNSIDCNEFHNMDGQQSNVA